jgi:Lon protease-like protein
MSSRDQEIEIGLLPVPAVLFPGGQLRLIAAKAYHQDLVRDCLHEGQGLGLVLAEKRPDGNLPSSHLLGTRGRSHPEIATIGTYCQISDFDQNDAGQLEVVIKAEQKLVIIDAFEASNGGLRAECRLLAPEPAIPIGPEDELLIGILEDLLAHPSIAKEARQSTYDHAAELGGRLVELLPIKNSVRQRFLEISDPLTRLTRIEKMLDQLQSEES